MAEFQPLQACVLVAPVQRVRQILLYPLAELVELDVLPIVQCWVLCSCVHFLRALGLQLVHEELWLIEDLGDGAYLEVVPLCFLARHPEIELYRRPRVFGKLLLLFGVACGVDLDNILAYDHLVDRNLVLLQIVLVIALENVGQVLLVHLLRLLALQLLVEEDLVALQSCQFETWREGKLQLQGWLLLQSRARFAAKVQPQVQRWRALFQWVWLCTNLHQDIIRGIKF